MRIDALDQEDADIDWFAVDADGHVLHVASGGGRLPESVAASEEDLLELHQYFLTLPETAHAAAVQVEPNAQASGRNIDGAVRYARRGLFSFDKTELHQPQDTHYHLVARPAQPLMLAELPGTIATLLLRTQVPGSATEAERLDVNQVA